MVIGIDGCVSSSLRYCRRRSVTPLPFPTTNKMKSIINERRLNLSAPLGLLSLFTSERRRPPLFIALADAALKGNGQHHHDYKHRQRRRSRRDDPPSHLFAYIQFSLAIDPIVYNSAKARTTGLEKKGER